jgi:leader peptidase (prepilin peptidase)/N-methyltransferase
VTQPAFWIVVAGLVGACVGSFLNVVIWRLPREESVARGRSHCPRCRHLIRWKDNVPVLSWILLRAKCRDCRGPISARYPAVEALTAGLFVLLALRRDLPNDAAAAGVEALLVAALVAVAFIDADHRIIPDAITKPGIVVGLLASFLFAGLPLTRHLPAFLPDLANRHLAALFRAALGALVGGMSLLLVRWFALLVFRKEGMGLGDVKLLAMVGAFSSWLDTVLVLLVASVGGSVLGGFYVWGRARTRAPLVGSVATTGGARAAFRQARVRTPRRGPVTIEVVAPGSDARAGAAASLDVTLPASTVWADDGKDVPLSLHGVVERVTSSGDGPVVVVRPDPLSATDEEWLTTFALHRISIPFGVFLSAAAIAVILWGDVIAHFILVTWPRFATGG